MKRTNIATGAAASADASTSNVYLDSLLWLTPSNPFPVVTVDGTARTQVSYFFGGAGQYEIKDASSSVDRLTAAPWTLPEQAAALQALQAWTSVANIDLVATPKAQSATFKLLTTTEA